MNKKKENGAVLSPLELEKKALDLRRKIIETTLVSGEGGHITSSFSCLDILVAFYFGGVLRFNSSNPVLPERDRFILSKGHGALAVYNVLCEAGFFTREELNKYCNAGSIFGGHPTSAIPGIECATGALGHGLPFAVGSALSARLKKSDYLTYVISGDGECQEGSIWEAAMSISQFNLTNLVWIIDCNNLQLDDPVGKTISLEPLEEKLRTFGFSVVAINGHSYNDLITTLTLDRKNLPKKPLAVVARTLKGKGVSLFENKLGWHGRKPNKDEYAIILKELGMRQENKL
jgi:transketolase